MFRHSIKIRLLASFVVAFICLNGVGAVCVAYCQTFDSQSVEAEHCPIKKIERHCDRTDETPTDESVKSFDSSEVDCCPMTVSFFGAPVEKPSFRFEPAYVVLATDPLKPSIQIFGVRRAAPTVHYRGPPFLDRRIDRIKNRILRI